MSNKRDTTDKQNGLRRKRYNTLVHLLNDRLKKKELYLPVNSKKL